MISILSYTKLNKQMNNITDRYNYIIYKRFNDLVLSGKTKETLNNKDLSTIFEYYTCLKFNEQYKQTFLRYDDIDSTFKEENRMSHNDTGIDASNLTDTIVQCKLRKDNLTLTECATFFASQVTVINGKPMVRWNNMFISRNSDSTLSDHLQEKLDYECFKDHTFDKNEMISYCENLKCDNFIVDNEIQQNIILRDYQIEAVKLINENKQNVILNLPTGTGKNIIIINSFQIGKKYLVLVPRIILMEQLNNELIGLRPEYNNKIQIIGDNNNKFDDTKEITICVYNSVDIIEKHCNKFEKIFIDEAHHIYKPEIYNLEDEDINEKVEPDKILINNQVMKLINETVDQPIYNPKNQCMIIGNTKIKSTREFYEACLTKFKNKNNDIDDDNDSDDEIEDEIDNLVDDSEDEIKNIKTFTTIIRSLTKYNNNVYLSATIDKANEFSYYSKDIRDMINNNYLCDYTIHIPIYNEDPTNRNICEYLIQNYRIIIVYCNSQKEGKSICEMFNKIQKGSAEYIDCNTSKSKRNNIISRFQQGDIPFLVNVRVLTEGFNSPITNGVCFLHLPSNKTTIIQVIGRALRKHKTKTYAKIILPYSVDEDEKNISSFLRTIARNDNRIKMSFNKKSMGGYINIDTIESNNEEENKKIQFKYEQIYSSIGKLLNGEEIWMKKFEELKQYLDENNKRPSNKKGKNKSLGTWLARQLTNYKKRIDSMSNQKIYNVWTEFVDDPKYEKYFVNGEKKWITNFNNLAQYMYENKKRPTKIGETKILNEWLITQMTNYNNKKKRMKNSKTYDVWTAFINDPIFKIYFMSDEEKWKINFDKLIQHLNENNKRPCKEGKNKILYQWLSDQIKKYNKKKEIMSNQLIYDKWTAFITDPKYEMYFISNEKKWEINFNNLVQHINEHNKRPSDKIGENKILGKWLIHQISNYKNKENIMSDKKIYDKWTAFINGPKYKKYFMG